MDVIVSSLNRDMGMLIPIRVDLRMLDLISSYIQLLFLLFLSC